MLRFLIKLLIASLLLYEAYPWLAHAYRQVLVWGTSLFAVQGSGFYDSSFRLIPLLALLLATTGLSWKRRLAAVAAGVCVFWTMDFVGTLLWTAPPSKDSGVSTTQAHLVYSLMWNLMGHWILPFVLWILPAHRQILGLFASPPPRQQPSQP